MQKLLIYGALLLGLVLAGCAETSPRQALPTASVAPATVVAVATSAPTGSPALQRATPSRTIKAMTATSLPSGVDPRAQAVDLASTVLGISKRFYIYTPPGYLTGTTRLPAVYLFRGHEREWINPTEDSSRNGQTVIDVYEDLLAEGKVGPMLLVFPGIASDDNRWPGMLINARQPDLAVVKGAMGTGRWEDYLLQELIPYVDQHYRTNPAVRAVDGFSLGGFMSVKLAAQYPELVQSVGAYDGTFFWDDPADAHSIAITDTLFTAGLFDPVWGRPPDRQFAAANNPPNLIRNGDPVALGKLQWLIEYGPERAEPNNANYYRGHHLENLLTAHGIVNVGGAITSGTHSWREADAHMRRTLPLHWQRLREVAP